jgi:hypothetical protein
MEIENNYIYAFDASKAEEDDDDGPDILDIAMEECKDECPLLYGMYQKVLAEIALEDAEQKPIPFHLRNAHT